MTINNIGSLIAVVAIVTHTHAVVNGMTILSLISAGAIGLALPMMIQSWK